MKLSIIVPVYNLEKYIACCLDSLCDQNVPKNQYEIIVVNDGSTDESGKIIDTYAKKCSNILALHKENGGVSSARNLALTKVTGDHIWFVDGDDMVARNSFQLIFDGLDKHPESDIFYLGVKAFSDNERISNKKNISDISEETEKYAGWMFTRIMRSRIILGCNITFDERVIFGEDDIFCVFYNQYVKRTNKLDKVIYYYRQREGSALHSSVTEKNFEKTVRSYSADLSYANFYDFFGYKKESVYKAMPGVMLFIAKQPFFKARRYIKTLKKYGLFPLPYDEQIANKLLSGKDVSFAKKLRHRSYNSIFRYYLFRLFIKTR